jgi:anti-sigma factor RsiW
MDCDALLDLMPDRAAGRAGWPEGAEAHLAACAECRRSWELIEAGSRVGAQAAARIDPDRISLAVMTRLAQAQRSDRRRMGWTWGTLLAAAAAIFLVMYPGPGRDRADQDTVPVAVASGAGTFSVPVAELHDLDAAELQAIDDQLDGALSAGASVAAPHIEELTPDEMQQVLTSMES